MQRIYELAITCFLCATLSFQIAMVIGASTGRAGGPRFWPILNYGMYDDPHHEGETINAYYLLEGTRNDGTTVAISARDLGFDFWNYLHLGQDLKLGRPDAVTMLLRNYKEGGQLTEIRVMSLPWKLTRTGAVHTPSTVLRRIPIGAPLEEKP
jgi:hypothetical protein